MCACATLASMALVRYYYESPHSAGCMCMLVAHTIA